MLRSPLSALLLALPLLAVAPPPPVAGPPAKVRLELEAQQLRLLLLGALESDPRGRRALPAIRETRAEITAPTVAVGAVVDLSKLPPDLLGERQRQVLERALAVFPFLTEDGLYLGVRGTPQAVGGELAFDRGSLIELGTARVSFSLLGRLLGLTDAEIERGLRFGLPEVEVTSVRVDGQRLLLEGVERPRP